MTKKKKCRMPTYEEILRNPDFNKAFSIYEFRARNIHGQIVELEKYQGNVCLIVNVASKHKVTSQCYKLLNSLYEQFVDKEFKILAFPCNQFNNTEPDTSEEILQFMADNNVKFDMFDKIDVNGEDAHPLWKYLKYTLGNDNKKGGIVKTEFIKFLCPRNGVPVIRFGFEAPLERIAQAVEGYLNA